MAVFIPTSEVQGLEEGHTVVFELTEGAGPKAPGKQGFLLRFEGELFAYLNDCPHWSVELDLGDAHFFDPELGRIYCKNHGALFHPQTGLCETGPCLGRALIPLSILQKAEGIELRLPSSPLLELP